MIQHFSQSPGGKDAKAMLWDLNDDKHLYTLDHTDPINSLVFSPNRYWLCAATGPSIKVWVSNKEDVYLSGEPMFVLFTY